MDRLRLCLVASELSPFAKTGGLADACAGLARYLAGRGHDLRPFLPLYSRIDTTQQEFFAVDFLRHVPVHMGKRTFVFSVFTTLLPGSQLPIYLIHCPELYQRPGIYDESGDEHLRFAFLARAVIESCQRMGWAPDVFHCNDWHTALLPIYLKTLYAWDPLFRASRSLLTIHNIAYQGAFGADVVPDLELGDHASLLHQDDLGRGVVGFLRTGILYADFLSTVSPTHAREICTPEYGMGLDEMLRTRSDHLVGILNGVDYGDWDPETDQLIPFTYSRDDLGGKVQNKESLLGELGLDPGAGAPLLGLVSRLTAQKGFDLLFRPLPELLGRRPLGLVALGTGEPRYQQFLEALQRRFPRQVVYHRGYSEELAHRIEAAADLFLMPSRYEPCGLNQMYSLRYGTPPVVRKTGGLADSVLPFDAAEGTGTGFVFEHFTESGLAWALDNALTVYAASELWSRLVDNCMAADFSWSVQGPHYETLYRRLTRRQVAAG